MKIEKYNDFNRSVRVKLVDKYYHYVRVLSTIFNYLLRKAMGQIDANLTDGWKMEKAVGGSLEKSPKTVTASRKSMEEGGMNVPSGSMSNIVLKDRQQPENMIPSRWMES